jgi:hypothetical protein
VKWTIIGLATAFVILLAGLFLFSGFIIGPALAPLQLLPLSSAMTSAGTTSLEGTWRAGNESVAGFRIPESFLVQSGTIVGRTRAVIGSLAISQNEVSSGSFQVDLSKLAIDGKPNASFFQLLETSKYPDATLTLTQPIVFPALQTNGQAISLPTTASLAMNGIAHTVTFMVKARSNGSVLEATGSAPVLASEWGIQSPFGVHNNAVIEFLVVLRRG